mgnify:FL=1
MKKIFANDNALKVISVIVAVLIWAYIILVLDPAVEVSVRDLPIQFVGEEQLNENGISVVNESATSISIKLKGSRKKMGRYDMKTIIAKADVSGISKVGQTTIPVEVVVPFENVGISNQSHYTVDVKTEKLVKKELGLEVKTTGSLAEDYMAGPIVAEPDSVTISGPESVIGKIVKAGVTLDYAGADVDIDNVLPIRFYGIDDKELLAMDALMNRVHQDVKESEVHCAVVKLRRVKIAPQFSAADADERARFMEDLSYTLDPEEVQIYGDDKLTAKISVIQTEPIPIEKFTDNDKVKVKLIVPDGVKILRDISEAELTLHRDGK